MVHTGTRELFLPADCAGINAIAMETANGSLGIVVGYWPISCDRLYAGEPIFGFSDCGPGGQSVPLMIGEPLTIAWDRRVYSAHVAPKACSGREDYNDCRLGSLVDSDDVTSGTIAVCTDSNCAAYDVVPFVIDLAKDALLIDVQ